MKNKGILITLILISVSLSVVIAEFNDLGCGSRPLGMGGAYVALSDDINAIYYNPAGLVRLKKNEFTSSYGRLYVGLDDDSNLGWGFMGYSQPLGNLGTVGLGYLSFTLLDNYSESTMMLAYGKWLTGRLALGTNVKLLKQKIVQDAYTAIDPVFEYGAKDIVQGFSADMGCILNLTKEISVGAAVYNINQPDMGFKEESKLKIMTKAGLSYRDETISTALDVSLEAGETKVFAGGEKWIFNRNFAIRSGLGIGTREYRNLTLGLGYSFGSLQFDYAFLFPIFGINDTYGSHRASLILRFGAWPINLSPQLEMAPKDVAIQNLKREKEEMIQQHEHETEALILKHSEEIEQLKREMSDFKIYREEKTRIAEKQKEEKRRLKLKQEAERKRAAAAAKKKKERAAKAKAEKKAKKAAVKPKKVGGRTTHKVVKGETLKSIAKKYYGDENKWKIIYETNTDKISRGKPKTGAVLMIPPIK